MGTPGTEDAQHSAERIDAVDRARETWIKRLIDTSRRNNLLYFRELKRGTITLSGYLESDIESLLNGESVRLKSLYPMGSAVNPADFEEEDFELVAEPGKGRRTRPYEEISRRLNIVIGTALANLEEKGLETLFLAVGMISWPSVDGGTSPRAPVVLVPIKIEGKIDQPSTVAIVRSGDLKLNLTLVFAIEQEFGVRLDEEILISPNRDDNSFDRKEMFSKLRELTEGIEGCSVTDELYIGNFSFQKMAMVQELQSLGDQFLANNLIAGLAGDPTARRLIGAEQRSINPDVLDQIPPQQEYCVLDADSSQQLVVLSASGGQSGVVQGPPGCGKSQTIANAIATLVAQGKKVLFVAEKRAALEAVYKRLENCGIGHIALDLHGATLSQKQVMTKVATALQRIRNARPNANLIEDDELQDRRKRLNEHDLIMHRPIEPFELSPYQLQGLILRSTITSTTRFPSLDDFTPKKMSIIRDLVREASAFPEIIRRTSNAPWASSSIKDSEQAQEAVTSVRSALEASRRLRTSASTLFEECQFIETTLVNKVEAGVKLAAGVVDFCQRYSLELLAHADELTSDLNLLQGGPFRHFYSMLFSSRYRAATKLLRTTTEEPRSNWIRDLLRAGDQKKQWDQLTSQAPFIPESIRAAESDLESLGNALSIVNKYLTFKADQLSFDQLEAGLSELLADSNTAAQMPEVRRLEAQISEMGAAALLEEVRRIDIDPNSWADLFNDAAYRSFFENACSRWPTIASFRGATHSRYAEEFRRLDKERMAIAAQRLTRLHAQTAVEKMNEFPEQYDLLRNEAEKKARFMPLRTLLERAPDVLTSVCPCWMASPLNVSQLLSGKRQFFDTVIFDEASQVLPEDAVCSIIRGQSLIVAGDKHQLPPTSFFADGADVEEDWDDATAGFESILDQMSGMVEPWSLDWHYRSEDERLIAFSNRAIYQDRLITFPGIGGAPVIEHVHIKSIPRDGEEDSASEEVIKVVDLIIEHAEKRPEMTLGVIAMGIKHMMRLQRQLDEKLNDRPELEHFFNPNREDRFFIKNLERVQGDERDAIILSVGYGKNSKGQLPYRFGPLLQVGGERRLNVVITRARKRMTVVSSFSHFDMEPGRSKAKGVELLRSFLEFAHSGGTNYGEELREMVPMNPFEEDVYLSLQSRGVQLLPQFGTSSYRLDFAVQHPDEPGKFIMAIECDGLTYHSSLTARDRDRLRQRQLERNGWRFHRIWSTDWFYRKEEEIVNALAAIYDAQHGASSHTTANEQTASSPPPVVSDRGDCPYAFPGLPIDIYSDDELRFIARWIRDDGKLRTDSDLISEMINVLGFSRRGTKIMARVTKAISETK